MRGCSKGSDGGGSVRRAASGRRSAPIAALLLLLPLLAGCAGVAAEGANVARDKLVVQNNIEAARAGNADAQYKVGDALCCSIHEGEGVYDTPMSVAWLCRAAAQGHGPAALKLGEIYSGDVISGLRVMRRVGQKIAGSTTDGPVAYAWLHRAETLGVKGANAAAGELWGTLTPGERDEASAMANGQRPLPCEWQDVVKRS